MTRSPGASSPRGAGAPMNNNTVYNEGVGVVVRVRPLSTKERADARVHNCIQCLPESIVIDGSNSKARGSGATRASRPAPASQPVRATTRPYQFSVDQVFHTHASQIEVYEQLCKRIVEGVFHGINGSILAYGATGSGKTHTMFGSTMSAAGIVYQAVQDIFAEKDRLEEEEGKRVRIKCSFLEVYNEDVFDLLARPVITSKGGAAASRDAKRVPLQVREVTGLASDADSTAPGFNTNGGLHIQGLTHIFPETLEEFARGIEHGHAQRFVAATDANAQSSRSHAIITVEVEVREGGSSSGATAGGRVNGDDADDGTPQPSPAADDDMADPASLSSSGAGQPRSPSKKGAAKKKKRASSGTTSSGSATAGGGAATAATPTVTIAKVQFADLAGSERAAATNNTGTRLREGGNINRSLLALGAVVQSLALQKVRRQQTAGKGGSKIFIPYRGSKLTRLLRDSIGGNCRTQMLFCLSPSTRHIEEAVNTMKFAMNAKEIQVVAYRNEFAVNSSQLAKTQEAVIDELREELALTRARLAMLTGEEGDNSDDDADADAPEQHGSEATVAVAAGKGKGQGSGRGVTEAAPASPKATRPAAASLASSPSTTGPSGRGSPSPTSSQGTPAAASLGAGFPPPLTGKGGQRGTLTPSAVSATAGGAAAAAFAATGGVPPVPGRSASTANNSRASISPRAADGPLSTSSSLPRPSVSSRTARPSVFAENTPLFSELEARLKNYSAQKESLYHEVRDAQERQRDGETQLREKQWRLATFLVSNASSSRLRGEVGGDGGTAVGVAGLRKVIAGMESSQAEQAAKLTELTARLDDVDRQFDATRQELLRERQGTALELLLDNTRLRQGCTEAECLAAHYHQECRSLFNREAEYADALSKCIEAIHRLRPYATHAQLNRYANSGNAVAAAEAADVALLYALLPTTATAQMMPVFESALGSAVNTPPLAPSTPGPAGQQQQRQHSPPSAQAFAHPPLAPSPTNRPGAGGGGGHSNGSSRSPVRGGGSVNGNGNHHLAEHFRDLVATAESLHLTGGDRDTSGNGADGGGGVRTRHGYLPSPVVTTVGVSGTAADPQHSVVTQQQQHTPGRKKEKARQRSKPGAVADPSAYGRTISPTGLTRGPTSAASAAPGKKRAGMGRKKSGGGGTGAAPAAGTALTLQRSLSAPTSFTRSASSTDDIAPAESLPRRPPTGLTARRARSISGAGGGGTPSLSATSDSAVKKASGSSPRRGPARGSVGSPRGIAFVRSNTAAALRAQASMNGSASSTGGSTGTSRTSDGAEGGMTGPRKLSYGGVSGSGNKFTTINTTVSYTTANGFGRTTGATSGSRKGAKHKNSSSGAGGAGASPPSTATSNWRRLTRSLTTSSICTPKRRSATSEDTGFSSQPDYTGGGTPTMTASLSRLSSSSSMNVSCESGLDRTNGGGGSAGHGSPDRGQGQRASPGSNVSGGAAGGGGTASPLTVARLLECSTTPQPSLPRYSSIDGTPTHSPAVKDGSAPLQHRHGQPSSAPLSRRKGSLADDLTVSRSTCASDAQSPNSCGLVSSPSY